MSLFDHRDTISEIATVASGELVLEEAMQKLDETWLSTDFVVRMFRGKRDVFILSETEEVGSRIASLLPHLRPRESTSSAPGIARIGVGARPHLRRDSPTSAPRLAHICAATRPHLRRDSPTSAPRLDGRTLCRCLFSSRTRACLCT
jgi:hypothetical protein